MQIASFLPHYQLVCISFDISSFSLISYSNLLPDLLKSIARFTQIYCRIYSNLLPDLLKSIAGFTQIYYRIYSNLLLDLLKSITGFTQFSCQIYSNLRTNLLNSPYSCKQKSVKVNRLPRKTKPLHRNSVKDRDTNAGETTM